MFRSDELAPAPGEKPMVMAAPRSRAAAGDDGNLSSLRRNISRDHGALFRLSTEMVTSCCSFQSSLKPGYLLCGVSAQDILP